MSPFDHRFTTLQLHMEDTPDGSVLWITLNRPRQGNALSMEMLEELHAVFDALPHPTTMVADAALARHPRVVVLRGAPGGVAFCGGVDIKAAARGIGGRAWDYTNMRSQQLLSRLIEKMRAAPQPVIAAVHGAAAGGGLALALAADARVAARGASFSAAFVKLGLAGTDMGTSFFLPRIVGLGVASEMLLTGRPLPAERAHALGLVAELVDGAAALEPAARRLAADMLVLSPLGLQLTKEQLGAAAEGGPLRAALAAENSHQMLLVNSPGPAARMQAWVAQLVARGAAPRAKM